MPFTLECAKTCPFARMCGDMFKKGEEECVSNVKEAVPNANSFETAGNSIEAKDGDVRVARIRAGNVTDPY